MRKLSLYIFIFVSLAFYIVLCFKLSEAARTIKELHFKIEIYKKGSEGATHKNDSLQGSLNKLEWTLDNREYQISLLTQTNELLARQVNRIEKEARIYRNRANYYERLAKFQSEPRFAPPIIYFTAFTISPRVNL